MRACLSNWPVWALALALASAPARAADHVLENLSFDLGVLTIRLPKVEIKGTPLDRAALDRLMSPTANETAAARLGGFDAAEIVIPEIVMDQTIGPQTQVTTYRDIRLSEIRAGRIGKGAVGGETIRFTDPKIGAVSGAGAGMRIEALDLRQIARVLGEAVPAGGEDATVLLGRVEHDGYSFDLGPFGRMAFGRSVSRDIRARPGPEPIGAVFASLMAKAAAEQAEPKIGAWARPPKSAAEKAEERRLLLAVVSFAEGLDYGSGEARDFVMTINMPETGGQPAQTVDVRMGRLAYGEDAPGKSGFAVEGLRFSAAGSKGSLGLIGYSGFSLKPLFAALREALAKPEVEIDQLDPRKFIPQLGTIRVADLALEVPQPPAQARRPPANPAPGLLKIGLKALEISAGDQINGVPTRLGLSIDGLSAPVIDTGANPGVRDLIAMGYRTVELAAKLDLAWQAASNELSIRALSLGGLGMARIEASGTLGNVTRDLFAGDLALAQVAALGATARRLDIRLQNLGLIDRLIENEARKARRRPEDLRREYATMASLGLAAILGPSDSAKALTAAIARFAAKPGTLSVSATANSASGLGLADVIALGDPTEILDRIKVEATAE